MSTILLLTPVIIAGWPAITGAVAGAAAALGLSVCRNARAEARAVTKSESREANSVDLEVEESEALPGDVGEDREIVLERDGMRLRVYRNSRGRCSVCASGAGHSRAELRALAEEFSRRMTQCFVYNKMVSELHARGFQVVEEEQMEDQSVRIHVRRWEG